jgi:glycerophosphoryl diester phosphodiesterase
MLHPVLSALLGQAHRHRKRPLPEAFRNVKLVAHRGGHTEHPENSLAAFREAAKRGYAAELDVRLSQEGKVVVFHDETLDRMTDATGWIADKTLAELQSLRLRGQHGPTDETIPTLREVLEVFPLGLIIELKTGRGPETGLEDAVVRLLRQHDSIHDRAILQSFDPFALRRVAELDPRLYRCQLFGTHCGETLPGRHKFLLRRLMLNSVSRPDAVAGELCLLTERYVKEGLKRRGYPVMGWTCRTGEDIEKGRHCGVDILISDYLPSGEDRQTATSPKTTP